MTSQAGYAGRAAYYAAETRQVHEPALLAGLLRPGLAVAEMPSGTGHFLPAYSRAGADITLVDACPQMLAAVQATASGNGTAVTTVCGMIEDLPARAGPYDLIVMPNGALNQLAAATPPGELLTAVARLLAPGGLILAQVLSPGVACDFYDPALADGQWRRDRQFPGPNGQAVARRRRQRHEDGLVHIEFELTCGGHLVHQQQVTLKPMTGACVREALASAGLRTAGTRGSSGLGEFVGVGQPQRTP